MQFYTLSLSICSIILLLCESIFMPFKTAACSSWTQQCASGSMKDIKNLMPDYVFVIAK